MNTKIHPTDYGYSQLQKRIKRQAPWLKISYLMTKTHIQQTIQPKAFPTGGAWLAVCSNG